MEKTENGGQEMYRNNGQNKAIRLFALRDYLYANADKTHAVRVDDIRVFYHDNRFDNASIKTVYADLHTLQAIGLDIDYDE